MLIQLPNITKYYLYLPLTVFITEAARHGPALGVIPVLIPDQPFHSILFVFYQVSYRNLF